MRYQRMHPENCRPCGFGLVSGLLTVLIFLAASLATATATAYEELPGDVQSERTNFAYDELELRVVLWLDKSEDEIYRKGEDLAVGFQTNADAYAVVYRVDTEGMVTVLWPRSPLDDGFVFGGHEYNIPVTGARRLRVSAAEGEGFVEAVVSRYPFDLRRLELDFHHEQRAEKYNFQVAGDPFLAMNEVNFAITGLEDPGDYVVTNYLSYYVHREVEHPRYLCNQCHFEDDTAYHPYRDNCSLEITVDHRWDNGWWAHYGYYPVYMNPVYVYVDPWTWRPWVNFWYTPYWRCPQVVVCDWYSPVHVWVDHPRYRGDAYYHSRDGNGGRAPLTVGLTDGPRRKTREYGQVTAMVNPGRPPRDKGTVATGGEVGGTYKGKVANRRPRERFEREDLASGNHGLRIYRGGGGGRSADPVRSDVRHTAGGKSSPPGTVPNRPSGGSLRTKPVDSAGTTRGLRTVADYQRRTGVDRSGTIRTVDPRQKGTRIWNSNRSGTRKQRPGTIRTTDPGPARGKGGTVKKGGTRAKVTGGTKVRKSGSSGSSKSTGGSSKIQRSGSAPVRRNDSNSSGGSRSGGSGSSGRSKSGGGGSKASQRR